MVENNNPAIMSKIFILLLLCCVPIILAGSDSVKLSKIEVLTLYHGRMTNGRRSSPVPQLKCVGAGTAGCKAFTPQVVQCYNRGSDGTDVQWECKTDMDNAYRFGQISVSCEGYSYPDDPYVLKGSCGLEYTIDLTKEGYENQQSRGHNYYGNNDYSSREKTSYSYSTQEPSGKSSMLGSLILLAAIGLVIYALYRTCIAPSTERMFQNSSTSDDFGGYPGGNPYRHASAPPPPGFRPEFTPGAGTAGASCGGAQGSGFSSGGGSTGAGGFWTGAATGGILGYMFGNRNSGTNDFRSRGTGYNSNEYWGGTRRSSGGSSGGGTSSTGTRTASGFGGTTRR